MWEITVVDRNIEMSTNSKSVAYQVVMSEFESSIYHKIQLQYQRNIQFEDLFESIIGQLFYSLSNIRSEH